MFDKVTNEWDKARGITPRAPEIGYWRTDTPSIGKVAPRAVT